MPGPMQKVHEQGNLSARAMHIHPCELDSGFRRNDVFNKPFPVSSCRRKSASRSFWWLCWVGI